MENLIMSGGQSGENKRLFFNIRASVVASTITATGTTSGRKTQQSDIIERYSSWFHSSSKLEKGMRNCFSSQQHLCARLSSVPSVQQEEGCLKRNTEQHRNHRKKTGGKGTRASSRKHVKRSYITRRTEPSCMQLLSTSRQCILHVHELVITLLCLDGWQDILQNSERLSVVISLSFQELQKQKRKTTERN